MESQSQSALAGSPSIRARLIAVVLLAVLPVLAFAAISLFSFASGERERYSAQALEAARRLAAGIDRELLSIESGLRILGTAQSVESGDFADFYNRAKQAKDLLGTEIIL